MSIKRRPDSPYWQIRFRIAKREIRASSRTTDRHAAEEVEADLRNRYWRQVKLGERAGTWDEAVARWKKERADKRSIERDERILTWFDRLLAGAPLSEIDSENIERLREIRARQVTKRTKRPVSKRTINREFALLRSILRQAAGDWKMLEAAPKVPMYRVDDVEPRWITREKAHELLPALPPVSSDMAHFSLATGMRRSEITHLAWTRVDLKRATAFVPASGAKNRKARVVPLNADAIAILERWQDKRDHCPPYVFSFRHRAPIHEIATAAWRRAVKSIGEVGLTFHSMRHSWASWQVMAGTPLRTVMELGGWESYEMVLVYAHLAPGHLAQYADRSELGPAPADAANDQEKRA